MQEMTLAERFAAEDRRLRAMAESGAEGGRLAAAAVLALLLHALLLLLPARNAAREAPAFPGRPPTVSVLRWMPIPEAIGEVAPPSAEEAPAMLSPPALVHRAPLPSWVLEPVPEPPPQAPLNELPAHATLLPPPPPGGERTVSKPAEIVRPLPIPESKVEPVYPSVAQALRARGIVELEVLVGIDGTVRRTRVLGCTRPGVGFEEAAAEAVAQWLFRPGRVGEEPVETTTVVRVEFR